MQRQKNSSHATCEVLLQDLRKSRMAPVFLCCISERAPALEGSAFLPDSLLP